MAVNLRLPVSEGEEELVAMATDTDAEGIFRRIVVGLKKHEQSDVVQLAKFTDCIVNFFAPNEISVRISCQLQDDVMLLYPFNSSVDFPFLKNQERKFINGTDLGSVILQHSPGCPFWRLPDFTDVDPIPKKTLNQGVYVGVAVVTESSDGRILMTQRPDHMRSFPRAWVPPGGHLEVGENVVEGGLRELEEETGLKFDHNTSNTRVLCLWESVYPVLLGIGSPKNHHIVVCLHTKSDETWEQLLMKIKLDPDEVQACTWLTEDDVKRLFTSGKARSWVTKKYLPGSDGAVSQPSELNLAQMFSATLWQEKQIYSGIQLALQRWLEYCHEQGGGIIPSRI